MTACEEDYCQSRDEKIIEADLLHAVDVSRLVEVCKCTYGILGQFHYCMGVGQVFHDAVGAMEDWPVHEYAHLIRSKVEEDLETVNCPR